MCVWVGTIFGRPVNRQTDTGCCEICGRSDGRQRPALVHCPGHMRFESLSNGEGLRSTGDTGLGCYLRRQSSNRGNIRPPTCWLARHLVHR